jgi:hypothetical protein
MASEIKVDTIVNAGGDNDTGIDLGTNDAVKIKIANAVKAEVDSSGHVKLDTVKGFTSAASVSVVGEGGSNTTNLQQGLAKTWFNNEAGSSPRDSFNVSGITDNQTGDDTYSLTSNMANNDYAGITAGWRDHDKYHAVSENNVETNHIRCRSFTRDTSNLSDSNYKAVTAHGDLA